jgi:hypothetical protein
MMWKPVGGFGGSFAVKFESISLAMADQKVNHAFKNGSRIFNIHRPVLPDASGWIYPS